MTTQRAAQTMATKAGAGTRAAFTLIELLVVIVIIGIIIAIVLPALGGVRRAARSAATKVMLTDITNAASTFQNDQKRAPGYFTAREMGSAENQTRGFSNMQNVMLDLAGAPIVQSGGISVGPMNDPLRQIQIDPDLIGVPGQDGGSKAYWLPEKKFFKAQDSSGQQIGVGEHTTLPSVVDHFGNPLLAWTIDDTAAGKIITAAQFGALTSPAAANGQASRFYWASNAAFLTATALGPRSTDQTQGSLLANTNNAIASENLMGMLGNPSYPYVDSAGIVQAAASARAPLTVQSAGADGFYLGVKDRGAKQFAGGFADYRVNIVPTPGQARSASNQYTDKDGKPSNIDVLALFDDIFAHGGN